MDKLPVYNIFIDESIDGEMEVDFVALVKNPAIKRNFIAFDEQKELKFSVDEEKKQIFGPAILSGFPIYREIPEIGKCYVVFNEDSILSIVKKFFAKGYNQNFNLSHDPTQITDGVSIYQSFITNEALGIKPMKGYEDAKNGSWFIGAQVTNDEVWNKIKEGEFQGFSVEGLFKLKKNEISKEEQVFNQLKELLSGI